MYVHKVVDSYFFSPKPVQQDTDTKQLGLHHSRYPELIDIFDRITSSLSLYDCVKLVQINHFFRSLFFKLALRPDYEKHMEISGLSALNTSVPPPPTVAEKMFLFFAESVTVFNDQPNKPVTDAKEEYVFNNFLPARKVKFLMFDQKGRNHVKKSGLDGPVVESAIAHGDFLSLEQAMDNKQNVMALIEAALQGNYSPEIKMCLRSPIVQECFIVGLLDITQDISKLKDSLKNCLEHPLIQQALKHRQITREHILQLNTRVLKALEYKEFGLVRNNKVSDLINKKIVTLQEVIQYPLQILFLAKNPFLSEALGSGEINKQQIVNLNKNQMRFLTASDIQSLIEEQVASNIKTNTPQHERGKTMARVLKIGKHPKAHQIIRLRWVVDGWNLANKDFTLLSRAVERADLLLAIETEFGNFKDERFNNTVVKIYFYAMWGTHKTDGDTYLNLGGVHCVTGNADVVRCLLLSGIDDQISDLVWAELISVTRLLELTPEQIRILADKSVNKACWRALNIDQALSC